MVENVKDILARAGFQEDQIKEEEYFQIDDPPPHIYEADDLRQTTRPH